MIEWFLCHESRCDICKDILKGEVVLGFIRVYVYIVGTIVFTSLCMSYFILMRFIELHAHIERVLCFLKGVADMKF